jgi:hypothetical protein
MTAGGAHLHRPDGSCRSVRPGSVRVPRRGGAVGACVFFPALAAVSCALRRRVGGRDRSWNPRSPWTSRCGLPRRRRLGRPAGSCPTCRSPTSVCVVRRRSSTCRNVQADPARALRSAPGRGSRRSRLRWLFQRPPRWPVLGKCGFSRAHSSFVRSPRPTTGATTPARTSHMIRRAGPRRPRSSP